MERSGSSGSGSGSSGNVTGSSGSGRAALPGGGGRVLLCLALTLTLTLLPSGWALPAPPRHRDPPAERLSRSWDLLAAANASLHRLKDLGTLGFECTLEEVDPEDITENQINTIKACTSEDPGAGNCPVLERSTFDKSKCLQGIYEDLRAYRAELKNLNDPKVLATIDDMMEALDGGAGSVPEAPGAAGSASFPERMRLCSVLQAFRIRTVTIGRIMNFLSSL